MPDVFWMYFGCSTEVLRAIVQMFRLSYRCSGYSTGVLLGVVPDEYGSSTGGTTGSSTVVLLGVVPDVVPDEYGSSTDVSRLVLFTSLCLLETSQVGLQYFLLQIIAKARLRSLN